MCPDLATILPNLVSAPGAGEMTLDRKTKYSTGWRRNVNTRWKLDPGMRIPGNLPKRLGEAPAEPYAVRPGTFLEGHPLIKV